MRLKSLKTQGQPVGNNQDAYSLAELLVAVGMLGFMFLTLYSGVAYGFVVTQSTREDLRGTQILVERIEGIRLFSWTQITDTNLNPLTFIKTYYPLAKAGESQGTVYSGTMTPITPTLDPPATYTNQMMLIHLTLTWKSGNRQCSRSMDTYVAKYGLQNYIYG